MSLVKATALVVRTHDFSETSRVVTLWTREWGKVRALAKGAKRLKSNFDSALDLLNVCAIVLLRKTSGALDLLTEAQAQQRFPGLRRDLEALYAGYYIAELLGDWSEDHDPHPALYDETLATLETLGKPGLAVGPRLMRFELVLLREFGYEPALEECAVCGAGDMNMERQFSAAAGGAVCTACRTQVKDRRTLSDAAWQWLKVLGTRDEAWKEMVDPQARTEVRQVLNEYITYQMGRRPRLLSYVGS
jgi:DNA repair protein RecO (recombination protein O)